jgi:hypothetical protein
MSAAMSASAMVGAQFVAARAARNAVFLTYHDPASLPIMIVGSSLVSIGLVAAGWAALRGVAPSTHVPATFAGSAALLGMVWLLMRADPALAARLVYLQIAGVGPVLGSGLWLIASELFDPRSARKHFGTIAAAGTAGGLAGGIFAERAAAVAGVAAMVPLVACLQLLCAWQTRSLARTLPVAAGQPSSNVRGSRPPSALEVLAGAPYLRNLAALVLLGTIGAIFVDYALMAQVKDTFGSGPWLARFFSLYYGAVSLLTFVIQAFGTRPVMEKLGIGTAAAAPSYALAVGSVLAIVDPGLRSLAVAHGGEVTFRASLLRAGYEVFYTPIAPAEKRAVKATIDVGVPRAGEIIGAGGVQIAIALAAAPIAPLLVCALVCSVLALALSRSLTHGYVRTLERGLVNRAVELDVQEIDDRTTRTAFWRSVTLPRPGTTYAAEAAAGLGDIAILRSADRDAIRQVLSQPAVPHSLVPYIIRLLARDDVADDAIRALRAVAEERVGELVDALLDPNQPFAVRRRLARVFSVCVSQRAADGLVLGLDDLRFEVRYRCARSLAAIVEKNPRVRIDAEQVLAVVRREVAVSESVWRGRQLLDGAAAGDAGSSLVDELVIERASQSLAHVFTLLGLITPSEPLRLAFCALHTSDPGLRGTALEYLDAVLPPGIRERVFPFIEHEPIRSKSERRREDILADLMQSNASIRLQLSTGTARPARAKAPGTKG